MCVVLWQVSFYISPTLVKVEIGAWGADLRCLSTSGNLPPESFGGFFYCHVILLYSSCNGHERWMGAGPQGTAAERQDAAEVY